MTVTPSSGSPGSLPADLWPDVQPDAARRLMLAGVESFAERGYHATTTRDIASAAGMSPAALYVHFPSKAALLFAISRSGHEQALAMVEHAAASGGTRADSVCAIVERFTSWHARRHTIARVVQYELGALPADEYAIVADLRRRTEGVVRDLVADGVEAGDFDGVEPATVARAILSLGIDVARWYSDRAKQTPDALGKEYGELVLRMLGVTSAAS